MSMDAANLFGLILFVIMIYIYVFLSKLAVTEKDPCIGMNINGEY